MKKRIFLVAILLAMLAMPFPALALNWDSIHYNQLLKGNLRVGTGSTPNITQNGDDVYIEGQLEVDGAPRFDASTMIIRGVTYTLPSADGAASDYLQTNGSGTLSWAAGTTAGMDDSYNTSHAITTDAGPIALSNTDADAAFQLTINASPSAGAAAGGMQITVGANSTEDALEFANSGSGNDIMGSGSTWSITKAGVATFASISGLTSGVSISGGAVNLNASSNYATNINTGTSSGAVTIGGGSSTVAINTSSWDITTAGAVSGVTTLGMSGDLTLSAGDIILATGKALKGSSTTAETLKIQAYDVDNTTYRDFLTLTNGDTITGVIGSGNETISINSVDWDIGTTGDMTGIGAITMDGTLTTTGAVVISNAAVTLYANEAITLTHATNGAADDLTIALTGANDSSIIIDSAGTGAGAVTLTATAGGITLNASSGIATSDAITGDGTAALGGFLQSVVNDADAYSVLVADSGKVITNAGNDGDPVGEFTLPSAAIGLNYCFVVMAAQELRVIPAAGDAINIAGVQGDAAEYWTASAVGESLCIVAVDVNNWVAKSYTGTWTQQTP